MKTILIFFIGTLSFLYSTYAEEPSVDTNVTGVLANGHFEATNALFYPDEYSPDNYHLVILNTDVEVGDDGSCTTKQKYQDKIAAYFSKGLPEEKTYNFPDDIQEATFRTLGTLNKESVSSRNYRQIIQMGSVSFSEVIEESHISGTLTIRGLNPIDELEGKFRAIKCKSFKNDFGS